MNEESNGEQPEQAWLSEIFEEDLYSSSTSSLVACLGSCCRTFQIMRRGLDSFGLMDVLFPIAATHLARDATT